MKATKMRQKVVRSFIPWLYCFQEVENLDMTDHLVEEKLPGEGSDTILQEVGMNPLF